MDVSSRDRMAFDIYSPSGWWDFLSNKPGALVWGSVEIMCFGPHEPIAMAAACAHMFASCKRESDDFAFNRVHVIYPASAPHAPVEQRFYEILVPDNTESNVADVERYRDSAKDRVPVHFRDNLDGYQLTELVNSFDAQAVILVVGADAYETGEPTPSPYGGTPWALERAWSLPEGSEFGLDDWRWSDRLARLAEAFVEKVEDRQLLVLLISQRYAPIRQESQDRLIEVDGAGVATAPPPPHIQAIGKKGEVWSKQLREGDVESVLKEIDELQLSVENQALLKAQALHAVGASGRGFQFIEPHMEALVAEGAPYLLIKLARMAHHGGKSEHALSLLRAVVTAEPEEEATLSIAIDIAHDLGADAELQELRLRVRKLLPLSDTTLQETFFACSSPSDYRSFAERVQGLVDEGRASIEGRFLYRLAVAFAEDNAYDRSSLLEDIHRQHAHFLDRAVLMVARHEFDSGHPEQTALICLGHHWESKTKGERDAVRMVLGAAENILLRMGEDKLDQDELSIVSACFQFVAAYLHLHPADAELRIRFTRIVSPRITGFYGYLILAELAVRGPRPTTKDTYERPSVAEPISDEDYMAFFERMLVQSADQGIAMLGQGPLPDTGGYDERRLLDHTWRLIRQFAIADANEAHRDLLIKLLHTGLVLTTHVGRPGEAQELIGRVAIGFSISGHGQMARDLAEHIIITASGDKDDLVFAWLEYAEVYLRCRRPHEAIAWLTIALSRTDFSWPPLAVYHAASLAARTLRDLTTYDLALEALEWARSIATKIGIRDATKERIDSIEMGIEVALLQQKGLQLLEDEGRVNALAERLTAQLVDAREQGDEVLPIATLLAFVVTMMSSAGINVDAPISELKATAKSLEGHARSLLLSLITPPETSDAIAAYVQGLRSTRHSEDASTDVSFAALLARLALAREDGASPKERLALLEWLTDRSVQVTHGQTDGTAETARIKRNRLARAVSRGEAGSEAIEELKRLQVILKQADSNHLYHVPPDADTIAAFTKGLSTEGIDVHVFALTGDLEERLVMVSAAKGELFNSIIAEEVFDAAAFFKWKRRYPYGYMPNAPTSGHDMNEFERTLTGIGLPLGSANYPVLLVPETRLQILPPNLVLSDGALSGLRRPMGSAPSMSWLYSIRQVPWQPSGRRTAWIPLPQGSNEAGVIGTTLDLLHVGIEAPLLDFGFSIHKGKDVPATLRQADVAVVGAHGAVHLTTEWFRTVADEEHLRSSPAILAEALSGTRLVILFVCNAGRLDLHPFASAVMGLPQMLLSRDCHAVLASPWPLDVSVPKHWLPTFLTAWDEGATVAEANFVANASVGQNYSYHPSHRLAMNLFGDPLIRATPNLD